MVSPRKNRLKTSVGIWAFGSNATRFMPGGYHVEEGHEAIVAKTKRALDGLGDLVDSYEYHYPGEINEKNYKQIVEALGGKEVYAIPLGVFGDPEFALGSFINPDPALRKKVQGICRGAIDICAEIGAKFLIWPGGEGYNYPFQSNYDDTWNWFIDGIAQAVDYANSKKVPTLLEHKNSEPAMKILMRDMGMSLYTVQKVKEKGVDTTNLKLNMDWQHLIMNGENMAEYAATLAREGLLGHQHANSGWGTFDDDNIVGALRFMETVELALELQRVGYGDKGERMGFDLFPYTEDQVEAVKLSVLAWDFVDALAASIDKDAMAKAKAKKDAVAAYYAVFKVLGMTDQFVEQVYASRK